MRIKTTFNKRYLALEPRLQRCLNKFYLRKGKHSIPLYDVLIAFFKKLREDDIVEWAYGVAFNFTLAIFPAIIFLFTLIPYIPIPSLDSKIMQFLADIMPANVYETVDHTIHDIVSKQRGGLLSFGFVSSLYLATNGMMSLIKTFHCLHKESTCEKRSYFQQRLIATLLTFMLAFVLFSAIVLLIVGNQFLDYLIKNVVIVSKLYINLILFLRFIIIFWIFFITISLIYYLAPFTKVQRSFVSWGALIATLLSIGASFGFSYYVNNFANYNRLYGSIGIMIALMVWLFILASILLIGFEFNASVDQLIHLPKEKRT